MHDYFLTLTKFCLGQFVSNSIVASVSKSILKSCLMFKNHKLKILSILRG